jgi:hypothetical protein
MTAAAVMRDPVPDAAELAGGHGRGHRGCVRDPLPVGAADGERARLSIRSPAMQHKAFASESWIGGGYKNTAEGERSLDACDPRRSPDRGLSARLRNAYMSL